MVVSSDKKNLQQTEQKAQLLTQGIKNNYSYSFTWGMLKQQSIFTQVHQQFVSPNGNTGGC